ncbi:MAG: 1-phosphofructokinase family hexose kinase [Bacteroidota bacterium]|nr:1-phosphofructokinase family hexose kinase [Bacteroidota bacterium]
MPSIVTITFNPAIDKSTSVAAMVPEKKMRCTSPCFEPGGGGVNVARAIHKLGGQATAVYLAGGYTGLFYQQLLEKENIPSKVITIQQHTRENLIVLDESSNQQYRFTMPGPTVEEKEWQQLLQWLEQSNDIGYIVASGGLPNGVPNDIFGRIAAIAKKKNSRLIIDTSGEAFRQALQEGVFLAKPNLGELSDWAGKEALHMDEVNTVAQEIISRGQCEVLVISMGAAGAMMVTKNFTKTIVPPVVKRKSTVGAGDSMVAGIVLSLFNQKTLVEAVQYGVACGTAATMNMGTALCKKEDADHLYAYIQQQ